MMNISVPGVAWFSRGEINICAASVGTREKKQGAEISLWFTVPQRQHLTNTDTECQPV